ncbi:hypothetical protein, partial [Evtepia sp.]|uniref:hypothetical protein n=1 Tax=Evtepia sp. TaxID=2773933 RepID=UPI00399973D0
RKVCRLSWRRERKSTSRTLNLSSGPGTPKGGTAQQRRTSGLPSGKPLALTGFTPGKASPMTPEGRYAGFPGEEKGKALQERLRKKVASHFFEAV